MRNVKPVSNLLTLCSKPRAWSAGSVPGTSGHLPNHRDKPVSGARLGVRGMGGSINCPRSHEKSEMGLSQDQTCLYSALFLCVFSPSRGCKSLSTGHSAGLFVHRVVSLKTGWLRPCLAEAGSTRLLRPGVAGENLRLGDIKASGPL